MDKGVPVMLSCTRSEDDSDFLSLILETPPGTAYATGAIVLPAMSR
jgi:hypothetical protein